jgi:hypothetical protein
MRFQLSWTVDFRPCCARAIRFLAIAALLVTMMPGEVARAADVRFVRVTDDSIEIGLPELDREIRLASVGCIGGDDDVAKPVYRGPSDGQVVTVDRMDASGRDRLFDRFVILSEQGDRLCITDKGIAHALSAKDGELIWRERLGGNFAPSPFASGDRILVGDQSGNVTVFRAGQKYEELGRYSLNERIMASPVPIGDDLIIRTEDALYRFSGQ